RNDNARRECEDQPGKKWVNGRCVEADKYNCEQDKTKVWVNNQCIDKAIAQNTTTTPAQTNNDAAIIRCIEEIEHISAFGFDGSNIVLYTKDGYMIPGDKALQFSRNWDYTKFTPDIDAMQATRSYNSGNGVQEHERDACETLDRLKNYLATVDKSTLKHSADLGAQEYLNRGKGNNTVTDGATAGENNKPVLYNNMDDLSKALDEECRNSGGTGRNADGDCQCPDAMTQTENKRQCACPDPTATYDKQHGKCMPGTISITPISAQPLSISDNDGLRPSSLGQGTVTTQQNQNTTDWSILENPTQDYGITKEKFCEDLNGNSYIGMSIALTNYRNNPDMLDATIKNGAGHGYQCKQLGGKWTVTREIYGRYWKCEIDKSKCAQGTKPQQVDNTENRDGYANTALAESILEQKCRSVEKNPMPLIFEYYCVGTTQRKCEELKTAFEGAGLPAPDVEFKAKIEEQLWPSGTRTIKDVCVVYLI
ncbi:MAG: hypothetical protein J5742_03005, partial [Alphaproteobacteria bacterium]|nr:hypothetical protein [Alphaproteobacteria bacterium]